MSVADIRSSPVGAAVRKRRNGRLGVRSTQVAILVVLLAGWQLGVTDASLPYFSRPTLVLAKLYELLAGGDIYRHIYVTLTEITLGYSLGAVFGLVLGFALGRSPFLSAAFQPYIIGLYSIPKIALAPVFIVWLGLGMASKV